MYIDYSKNSMYLQDIVKGSYGRKTSYYNAEEVSEDNVLKILSSTIGDFNKNRQVARYLHRYKSGDQPILYRKKLVREDINNHITENHAFEVVQFSVSQTYGEPIQYVSTSEDERINKAVDKLNSIMKKAFKYQRNVTQGEWKSTSGTSFLALQEVLKNKEVPFRIVVPTPLNTYIVYSEYTEEPLLSVQQLKDENGETYYLCFSENHFYKIKNGKIIKSGLHTFGGIPIIEVPNNADRLSDLEIIITLLDSINMMQSNRMDGIEQFVQAWVKFVNCEIDEETFRQMKEEGALCVKSNNGDSGKADVDIMSSELNQSEAQIAKDDLWNNALSILAIPNKEGNTGGDTQGAVTLRNGWDHAKSRAKIKDAYVIEAEVRFAKIALNILRVAGNDLGITINDFDVNIPHSPQDNMSVKATVLQILLQAGIHPLVAIKVSGLWNDAEKVFLLSKPYLDVLYKTIDDEIANIPNSSEQMSKANQLVNEYKSNGSSKLKERIANAIEQIR